MTEKHQAKPPLKPQVFSYSKPPEELQAKREVVRLCQIPTLQGSVQVVRQGAGEHLHSHASVDGFWMVLRGCVAFYGDGDVLYGKLGPGEGILMPRGNRYWFEAVGEEDAEIIQVLHIDREMGFKRQDHEKARVDGNDINVIIKGRVIPSLSE